jgi:hypothetical protein
MGGLLFQDVADRSGEGGRHRGGFPRSRTPARS